MLNLEINKISKRNYEVVCTCGKKKYTRNPIGDFEVADFNIEEEIDKHSIFYKGVFTTPEILNRKLELKLTNIKSLVDRYSKKFNIIVTTKDIKFELFNCIVTGCEMYKNVFKHDDDTATLIIQFDYCKKIIL